MKTYGQFHDGSFDGLLVEDKTAHVFATTYEKQRYVLIAAEVVALVAGGLRAGNIIFDVQTQDYSEISLEDVIEVYGYRATTDDQHARNSLEKSQREGLVLLSVNPSYGGSCLVLAQSVALLHRQEWTERYLVRAGGWPLPSSSG
jgi:hypothetical protein